MNWKPILFSVLGAFAYFVISMLLPNLNHALAGMLGAATFLLIYYLLPKKIQEWKRALITIVPYVLIVYMIRLIFV